MTAFRLAWLNLTRRRVPTTIALASIAISIACSGVLLRLYRLSGSRFSTLAHGGDALIGAKAGGLDILLGCLNLEGKYPDFIPAVLYESLKQRRGVQFEDGTRSSPNFIRGIIPFVYFAQVDHYRVIGTDENFLNRPDSADSPRLSEGRWASAEGEVVLGSEVAAREHWKVGSTFNSRIWFTDEKTGAVPETPPLALTVTGIFAPQETAWDQALFSNLQTAHAAFTLAPLGKQSIWGPDVLHFFLVYLQPDAMPALQALINKRTVAQAVDVTAEEERLQTLTGTGRKLGVLMCFLILLLGALGVAAMMVTRFDAMTIQLAVLRALGYRRSEIRAWLVWEGCLLGVAACAIGAILDGLLFPAVRALLGTALPSRFLISSSVLQSWPVWAVAMLSTIIAVFIPLLRVYRQDIHGALKGT
jgi:putative ABC transport system permease protein